MIIGIIDDHEDIATIARLAFSEDEVLSWPSGGSALQDPLLRECDVIVLDWSMRTGMGGADFLTLLGPDRPCPIVVYTAGGWKKEVMGHPYPPDEFLSKGYSMLEDAPGYPSLKTVLNRLHSGE